MLELGKRQSLQIQRLTDIGAYVGEPGHPEEAVLLPRRQVPEGAKVGDEVEVLLYRDSEDRLIATVHESRIVRGKLAVLRVVQAGDIGAFLDWGLERDLFLPFREQTHKVAVGEECLVGMYLDKSGRLAATMRIYDHLSADSPYKKGDTVSGTVYEVKDLGAFVAVDDAYFGLIPPTEVYQSFRPGDQVTGQVMRRRPDGKLDLRVRRKAYRQMNDDAADLLARLDAAGGFLPYNDHTDPEVIRAELGLSKAAFKRAVGHLLKEGKAVLTPSGLQRKDPG